jgi:hypothetical protein
MELSPNQQAHLSFVSGWAVRGLAILAALLLFLVALAMLLAHLLPSLLLRVRQYSLDLRAAILHYRADLVAAVLL